MLIRRGQCGLACEKRAAEHNSFLISDVVPVILHVVHIASTMISVSIFSYTFVRTDNGKYKRCTADNRFPGIRTAVR